MCSLRALKVLLCCISFFEPSAVADTQSKKNAPKGHRTGVISDETFAACAAALSNQIELFRTDMVKAAHRGFANANAIEYARWCVCVRVGVYVIVCECVRASQCVVYV